MFEIFGILRDFILLAIKLVTKIKLLYFKQIR